MATLFISDLHLSDERPNIIGLFQTFLQEQAKNAEALYILGDLFEVWVGDDAIPSGMSGVLNGIANLTKSGVPVYVMAGNRDFLMGENFEAITGSTLIPDPSVINLYGTPTLLMHGDTLCTDDEEYQQFRSQVRDPAWQTTFLAKSVADRTAMGHEAREKSQASTREKSEAIMDANAQAVISAFRDHKVMQFIHGHTHRPAVHHLTIDNQPATRIVLGDWYEQASVLRVNATGFSLSNNKSGCDGAE